MLEEQLLWLSKRQKRLLRRPKKRDRLRKLPGRPPKKKLRELPRKPN